MERVYTIFISASDDDALFKQIVEQQLKKTTDLTIIDRALGGTVEETIKYADLVLALLTRKSIESTDMRREIEIATSMNKRIIAVTEECDQAPQLRALVPDATFLAYAPNAPLAVLTQVTATVNRLVQQEPRYPDQTQLPIQLKGVRAAPNLEHLVLSVMSESRLKTFTPFDLAIDTGAPLDAIQTLIKDLERDELVRRLDGGYYSITYKGLDRVRGRSRIFEQR